VPVDSFCPEQPASTFHKAPAPHVAPQIQKRFAGVRSRVPHTDPMPLTQDSSERLLGKVVRQLDVTGKKYGKPTKWLGLSDFFAGMEEGAPPRGIKVGWSSAGMAVVTPHGEARSFLAWGDHSARPEEWAIATHPPASIAIKAMRLYRVRHQMAIGYFVLSRLLSGTISSTGRWMPVLYGSSGQSAIFSPTMT
jgi:hypothetical protein